MCKLKKTLYELKQSPRVWFGQFASVVQKFDLSRSQKDHPVFFRQLSEKRILIVVCIDDIVVTSDDAQGTTDLNQYLLQHFQPKDLGSL